jgi:hypothetical protein
MRQPLLFVAILIFSTSGLSGILVEEPISVPIDSIHEAIISMTVDWDVDSDGDGVPDVNESGEDESTSTDWNKAVAEELGDTSYKTDEYGTEMVAGRDRGPLVSREGALIMEQMGRINA